MPLPASKFTQSGRHRLSDRPDRRKQPADQSDNHRKNDTAGEQRQGNIEGESDLAEAGEIERGGAETIEDPPGQAGADHPANKSKQQGFY